MLFDSRLQGKNNRMPKLFQANSTPIEATWSHRVTASRKLPQGYSWSGVNL